jgi:hypothetical protein
MGLLPGRTLAPFKETNSVAIQNVSFELARGSQWQVVSSKQASRKKTRSYGCRAGSTGIKAYSTSYTSLITQKAPTLQEVRTSPEAHVLVSFQNTTLAQNAEKHLPQSSAPVH